MSEIKLKGSTVICNSVLKSRILRLGLSCPFGDLVSGSPSFFHCFIPSRDWGSSSPRAPVLTNDPALIQIKEFMINVLPLPTGIAAILIVLQQILVKPLCYSR